MVVVGGERVLLVEVVVVVAVAVAALMAALLLVVTEREVGRTLPVEVVAGGLVSPNLEARADTDEPLSP